MTWVCQCNTHYGTQLILIKRTEKLNNIKVIFFFSFFFLPYQHIFVFLTSNTYTVLFFLLIHKQFFYLASFLFFLQLCFISSLHSFNTVTVQHFLYNLKTALLLSIPPLLQHKKDFFYRPLPLCNMKRAFLLSILLFFQHEESSSFIDPSLFVT